MKCIRPTEFVKLAYRTAKGSKLASEDEFTQHGDTSCLLHSVAVAYYSYKLALKLGRDRFNIPELVRGALLHDYFLYDWHVQAFHENGLHGFSHPYTAFQNANRDFMLTKLERDIIRKHMFPLTLDQVPMYRESVIVSLIDKWCSSYEVFIRKAYRVPEIRCAYTAILHANGKK